MFYKYDGPRYRQQTLGNKKYLERRLLTRVAVHIVITVST